MSEYRDIHNNLYTIIQRSVDFANDDDKEFSKEQILEELFNIFVPARAKAGAGANASQQKQGRMHTHPPTNYKYITKTKEKLIL